MSDLNLLRYYSRLVSLGVGKEIKTALPDVAEALFTSPRHARNLLGQMQQYDWLTWQPKVGRNQRSTLILNTPIDQLRAQLASKRILEGKYEKALSILDNDQAIFGRLLQSTSGASMREGRLHIQLTYKRAFERLVPHQLHRSSERYFIRQIYCCLVSSNPNGYLEPQLAHHWHYNEQTFEWTFYLRPGLSFHNGEPITAQCIAELFNALRKQPIYKPELSHLKDVTTDLGTKVIFHLAQPDFGFGGLISGVKYAIQPTSQLRSTTNERIIGSGVFEVTEQSETRLCLQAFDRYYACRSLTDQVTIWHFDHSEPQNQQIETNLPNARGNDGCQYYLSQSGGDHNDSNIKRSDIKHTRIEDGCVFMLFNQHSPNALTSQQRRYLSTVLTPDIIYQQLEQNGTTFGCEKARNLLSIWQEVTRPPAEATTLPEQISIAVYDYNALDHCANAAKQILENQGVNVTIHHYSYRELIKLSETNLLTDHLIITNINLDDNRHASAFGCLYHNPILQNAIGEEANHWLVTSLQEMRSHTPLEDYLQALEPISSALINQYWLAPLFHHRQTLRFHDVLNDVALTNWGWPDLRSVWSTD